jgi:hypothetical protein
MKITQLGSSVKNIFEKRVYTVQYPLDTRSLSSAPKLDGANIMELLQSQSSD